MARMTVSLPEPMKDWIEARIRRGDYASVSDHVRDLVRRDRDRHEQEPPLDGLRKKPPAPQDSGVSARTIVEIYAEARGLIGG